MRRDYPLVANFDVYDSLDAVSGAKPGQIVYISGEGIRPEGYWRRTKYGEWRAAGINPRKTSSITQRTVPNGGTFIILQFNMPASSDIVIWESILRNTQGNNNGLFLEIQDTDAGETIYQYDASEQAPNIEIGNPVAQGGTPGNQIRIRGRNSSAQSKEVSGYLNWSFEFGE